MHKTIEIHRPLVLHGPNMWTYRPALEVRVDIGALEDFPSNLLPGLYERLSSWLPGLIEHRCSVGERGGFLKRLQEGTWPAHILEHVTLELQGLAGQPGGFGRARETSRRGVYKVVVRCPHETLTLACLYAARDLLMAAINDQVFDLAGQIAQLQQLAARVCLEPGAASIVAAAAERGIPSLRLNDGNLVQLGHGCQQRRIWTAQTDQTSAIAVGIARRRQLTRRLLQACALPLVERRLVSSAAEAWQVAQELGLPVIVRSWSGKASKALANQSAVAAAYRLASQEDEDAEAFMENWISDDHYRLLVVGGRLVTTVWCQRGQMENSVESWSYQDVSHQIHADFARVACLAARVIGLDIAGVELQAGNITQAVKGQPVAISRVLANPDLNLHVRSDHAGDEQAMAQGQNVGAAIVAQLFPVKQLFTCDAEAAGAVGTVDRRNAAENTAAVAKMPGRIPLIGVSGSRDTTLTARLVAHLLRCSGWKTGLASRVGMYVDRRSIHLGSALHAATGQQLLCHPALQAAVFESDCRSILESGLAYDRCLIGIVTHVDAPEDLLHHDILTREQVYRVLRTQVDVVLPSGVAILNADDPQVMRMAELCDGEVILYSSQHGATGDSVDIDKPELYAHLAQGGRAVLAAADGVWLCTGLHRQRLCTADLPLMRQGKAVSLLAALAAAWFMQMSSESMLSALDALGNQPVGVFLPEEGVFEPA